MPNIMLSCCIKTQLATVERNCCIVGGGEKSRLHKVEAQQQPADITLRPTFVQKLCHKLPSIICNSSLLN